MSIDVVLVMNAFDASKLTADQRMEMLGKGIHLREADAKHLASGKASMLDKKEFDALIRAQAESILGPSASPTQESILLEAERLVNGPRQNDYGHPLDNWTRTAKLWSPILGIDVTAEQALLCMVQVKVARLLQTTTHRDSQVDVPGYMLAYNKTVEERKRRTIEAGALPQSEVGSHATECCLAQHRHGGDNHNTDCIAKGRSA